MRVILGIRLGAVGGDERKLDRQYFASEFIFMFWVEDNASYNESISKSIAIYADICLF